MYSMRTARTNRRWRIGKCIKETRTFTETNNTEKLLFTSVGTFAHCVYVRLRTLLLYAVHLPSYHAHTHSMGDLGCHRLYWQLSQDQEGEQSRREAAAWQTDDGRRGREKIA